MTAGPGPQTGYALYAMGVDARLDLAIHTGAQFRKGSLDFIRLYDGVCDIQGAGR